MRIRFVPPVEENTTGEATELPLVTWNPLRRYRGSWDQELARFGMPVRKSKLETETYDDTEAVN